MTVGEVLRFILAEACARGSVQPGDPAVLFTWDESIDWGQP